MYFGHWDRWIWILYHNSLIFYIRSIEAVYVEKFWSGFYFWRVPDLFNLIYEGIKNSFFHHFINFNDKISKEIFYCQKLEK